ncbi:hypothetical protein [Terrabacter terrigena]|uniref:CopG family transcriptional regulator n=1 Tax=Terrabacter terrigena TaxID=574718 RepID=A0ABW3MT79_9MICO
MPETAKPADRTKVLSVRLTSEEFDALSERATEVGVGPSTLARTLVRRGLAIGTSDTAGASAPSSHPDTAAPSSASLSPLEAQLVAGLAARIEVLERWVAEH